MFEPEDDDLDFVPAAGSKLASLFGSGMGNDNGNSSLVYTPQKKPKPVEQGKGEPHNAASKPPGPALRFSVIIADIVHCFKLESGLYSDQKKIGVAVLGNAEACVFQVLLYRTTPMGSQDYVAVAKVNERFSFTVQPKFYCNFYDESKNYWSIVFSNQDTCMQFARQVGAARFRGLNGKVVITQMIDPGEETTCKENLTHFTISQQNIEISSIAPYCAVEPKIKVSVDPSQANWSKGLVGAAPGSKWAVFIPALTVLPWTSEPSRSPLVLEVIVEKPLQPSISAPEKVEAAPSVEERSVQAKGASLTESLSNVSSSKANLISRVSRLGQATLPLKGATFSNPTDSEDTEEENPSVTTNQGKPSLKPKFTKNRSGNKNVSSESEAAIPTKSSGSVAFNTWRPGLGPSESKVVQYVPGDGQIVPVTTTQFQLMTGSSVTSSPADVSLLMSETRMQNAEMRMNMMRLVDKVENISLKVDALSTGSGIRSSAPAVSGGMDASTLLSSIEKLVRDNQTLTAEVAEKKEKLNELNERIFGLVDTNAKILEQNRALLEEKQKAPTESPEAKMVAILKEHIETLENEKKSLVEKVAELEKSFDALKYSNLQIVTAKDTELNAKETELSQKISELKTKESELQEKNAKINDLETTLADNDAVLKAKISELSGFKNLSDGEAERLKAAEGKANRYEADNAELKELVTSLSQNISDMEATISKLKSSNNEEKTGFENQIKNFERTIGKLKAELEAAPKHQDFDSAVTDLKLLMNKIYRKIGQYFNSANTLSGTDAFKIVGLVLKSEVSQYTEELLLRRTRQFEKADSAGLTSATPAVKESSSVNPQILSENSAVPTENCAPKKEEPVKVEVGKKAEPKIGEEARTQNEFWRSEPPPVPKFEEEEEESDDWLNM